MSGLRRRGWAIVWIGLGIGCDSGDRPAPAASRTTAEAPSTPADLGGLRLPAVEKLIAIGDLHGDIAATRRVLSLAGVLDDDGHWKGGMITVVQTGDQIDRGDGDREILDLLERLEKEAKEAGGQLRVLNGNHETMNVLLDFRYVTPGAYAPFAEFAESAAIPPATRVLLDRVPEERRGRAAAFGPGGPYARKLAERPITLVVGDTAFAHGGILPKHIRYGLPKMDAEVKAWMRGEAGRPPAAVIEEDAPVWARDYSDATDAQDCRELGEALGLLGVKRMVVGHTVQKGGVTSACEDRVWRIDVGMSAHYGGTPQALQIVGGEVTVLKE